MKLDELVDRVASGDIPTGALALTGIVVLLLTLKVKKGVFKILFLLAALSLFALAAWWHVRHR